MGSDLSVVNSARVSFGKHKQLLDEKDEKLISYSHKTSPYINSRALSSDF
jgi:hypothetical protein